jgi:TonB family protein
MKYIYIISCLLLFSCSNQPTISTEAEVVKSGFVKFRMDISSEGEAISPVIIDSHPEGKFDKLAMRKIKEFKFKPKIVEGIAVTMKGLIYTMKFDLAKP